MDKLTKEKAIEKVKYIKSIEYDLEIPHIKEDKLRDEFINCVAMGMYTKGEASQIATIVASTSDIDFERYYSYSMEFEMYG